MTTQGTTVTPPADHAEDFDQWRWKLPGFNLPLNFNPLNENNQSNCGPLFPNALGCRPQYVLDDVVISSCVLMMHCRMMITTLREFTMMRFMDQLTDKPNWDNKVGHNRL